MLLVCRAVIASRVNEGALSVAWKCVSSVMDVVNSYSIIQTIGLITAVCGTLVLQTAWRKQQRTWSLIFFGWGLVFVSLFAWSQTTAADKGFALGLVAWVVIVLLFLVAIAIKSPKVDRISNRSKTRSVRSRKELDIKQIVSNISAFLAVGPLSGLVALLMSSFLFTLFRNFDVEYSANLTTASISFPLLWAGIAVMIGYQKSFKYRYLSLSIMGITPFLGLLAFNGSI